MSEVSRGPNRFKVVYIAGYGRSGTTLLDIALGQHERTAGLGELSTLSRHVWQENEYCSCGQKARDCPLWGTIGRQWIGGFASGATLADYTRRQVRMETLLSPWRIFGTTLGRRAFKAYENDTLRLLECISSSTQRDVLVDSSKLPGRASALAAMPAIELFVIHFVRDGRGVAWSLLQAYKRDLKSGVQKEIKPKPPLRTALRWLVVNLAAEMLRWRVGRRNYLRMRYEDFVADPVGSMDRIGDMIGLDLAGIGRRLEAGEPIHPAHQIAGNRLRMNKSIRLAHEEAWRSKMPAETRTAFNGMGGWLLRRYGYEP